MLSVEIQEKYSQQSILVLENDHLRASFFLPRGAEMFELVHKKSGIQILRQVDGFQQVYNRILKDSLTNYDDSKNPEFLTGGWWEMFPHASRPLYGDSVAHTMHGHLRFTPMQAKIIENSNTQIVVEVVARMLNPAIELRREYRLSIDSHELYCTETAINLSGIPIPYLWGHHPTFGVPFIDDALVEIDALEVRDDKPQKFSWPYFVGADMRHLLPASPNRTSQRMLFLSGLARGEYSITNSKLGITFKSHWDKTVFPMVWYWNLRGGESRLRDSFALEFVSGMPVHLGGERKLLEKQILTHFSITLE